MNDNDNNNPPYIGWLHIILSVLMMVMITVISVIWRLKLEKSIIIATFRTVLQLTLLGYILKPIFEHSHMLLVLLIIIIMIILAARESYVTPSAAYGYQMFFDLLIAISVGVGLSTAFALAFVINANVWWNPRYFIPMVGMLLGNSIKGTCLALQYFMDQMTKHRQHVEVLLAMGATSWEAAHRIVKESVRLALMPQLNSMMVIGLVSIPGMMTGQVMGGSSPQQAARYQIVIMMLISSSVCFASIIVTILASRHLFSNDHRLLREHIIKRAEGKQDVLTWLINIIQTQISNCRQHRNIYERLSV